MSIDCNRIKINSSKVESGDVFIPIIGETHDGHEFITDAISRGARVVYYMPSLFSPNSALYPEVEFLQTADTTALLSDLARDHLLKLREVNPKLRVIAITGSVGKTTTKDLTAHILAKFGKTVAAYRSYNNEIGVPLTAFEADEETEFLVMEIGANHVGEIARLVDVARPDVAVCLKAGVAHLGEFGGVDNIVHEKAQIFSRLTANGFAVLNADDLNAPTLRRAVPSIVPPQNVCEFSAVSRADEVEAWKVPLPGKHNYNNILAAVTIAGVLGIPEDKAIAALADFTQPSPHRMAITTRSVGEVELTVIDDAYNANPDSMKAALDVLAKMGEEGNRETVAARETVAILGDMFELGEETAAAHSEVIEYAKTAGIGKIWTVGEHFREFNTPNYATLDESKSALKQLVESGAACDVIILLKGSNSGRIWELQDVVFPV